MAGTNFKVKNGLEIQSGTLVVSNGAGSSGQVLKSTGTGVEWGTGSSGSGDVVGPASATDNAVTRFDSTTGKLIQNSTVTLDDNGNFGNVNSVVLDNTPATLPTGAGTMYWEDGEGTAEVILKGGNTTLKVGTQEYARVYNDSGSTITLGQVVYISGAQGNRIAVKLAKADVEANSFGTLGLVAETIANGAEGWVIVSGALYKLNTLGLTAGAVVYLSPTTAGAYTTTKPQAPDQLVVLGFIERVSSTVGSIYVKVDNGYELDELHDVRITSPISGNTLIYDATTSPTGVWKNASLTAGTGISVTNGAGSITIGNTGVTSVSGTSPVVSSGGATPAISLASGYGDTQNPYGSKTANYFLASPNGSAGVPTWRSIVAADIPTLNQNTTGTAANVTGIVAVANGGTGLTTLTAGYIPYGNGTSAFGSSANLFWDSTNSRLGLGTNSPAQKLDINGKIRFTPNTADTNYSADIYANYNSAHPFQLDVKNNGSTAEYLGVYADGGGSNNRVVFPTGNVGIGITSPSAKLSIYKGSAGVLATLQGGGTACGFAQGVVGGANTFEIQTQDTATGTLATRYLIRGGTDNANHEWYAGARGSEAVKMFLEASTGNVGIGTNTPASKLNVSGGNVTVSAGYGIAWSGDQNRIMTPEDNVSGALIAWASGGICRFLTASTERMRIDSSGNLGLGTSSPYQAKLDVSGVGGTGSVANIGASNSNLDQLLIGSINRGSSPAFFSLPTGSAFVGAIGNGVANTLGIGTYGAAPVIFGTSNTERMRIDSSGNLGIGSASPYNKVEIEGASARLGLNNGGGASRKALLIEPLGYGGNAYARLESYDYGTSTGGVLALNVTGGNVGIGTSSPAFKLHTYIASGTSMFKFESGANAGIYGYWTRPNQSYIQALNLDNNGDKDFSLYDATNGQVADRYYPSSTGYRAFFTNGSERMRITSTEVKATVPFIGNSGTKGFGAVTTTTSTSTPTGGSSGDHYYIY